MRTYEILSNIAYRQSVNPWESLAHYLRKPEREKLLDIVTWLDDNARLYHFEYKKSVKTIQSVNNKFNNNEITVLRYFVCVDSEEDAALLKLFIDARSEEEEIAWLLS